MSRTARLSVLLPLALLASPARAATPVNANPPASPVKLVFVHHSTGENWLNDGNGRLGVALRDASYFVSDTNYGWGPVDPDAGGPIGDHTDIGSWWRWFSGPRRAAHVAALYTESGQHSDYLRMSQDPGGENRIVMFKSCFPNSSLGGSASDPIPPIGSNPLRGEGAGSEHHTIANAKGIYLDLLTYFASRTDKLFVVVTAPPLAAGDTSPEAAANTRTFNLWLLTDWLRTYAYKNVAVLDFYNVLTSNAGATRKDDPDRNDLGWADGNHHRVRDGAVEHLVSVANDVSAYWTGDSHPSMAGNLKATGELVPLLNVAYHCWQGTGGCPAYGPPPSCTVSCSASVPETAVAGTPVSFAATASASGCASGISYDWDFGDFSPSVPVATVSHTYTAPGTYPWRLLAWADGARCERFGSITITSGPQPLPFAYVVPAVAHTPGAEGSLWRTDVAGINRTTAPATVRMTFQPVGGTAVTRETSLSGPGAREWGDVLVSVFGYAPDAGVSGPLLVSSDRALHVTSRTYNQAATGTFGGYLAAVEASSGITREKPGLLPHLKKSAVYRTNIGVVNLGSSSVEVALRLFGASGVAAGSERVLTVPPGGLVQENDVFVVCGAGSHDIAWATVEVRTEGGRVTAFASVIDGRTNDPTIVPLVVP